MAVYTLERVQQLPIPLEEAWTFFSSPANLKVITPPEMDFNILSGEHWVKTMYAGQIIAYTVRPLWNIPMYWMTEITQVREKEYFIDEQRSGPYALWHHQHHFRPAPGGVEMIDLLHYKLPLGWLGDLAHVLFVRRRIEDIFNYRQRILEKRFGTMAGS